MLDDRPLRPVSASLGMPHSGAKRGKNTNSAIITGAPASAMRSATPADSRRLGWPTGRWALTSAVSSPSSATSMAAATGSDCE